MYHDVLPCTTRNLVPATGSLIAAHAAEHDHEFGDFTPAGSPGCWPTSTPCPSPSQRVAGSGCGTGRHPRRRMAVILYCEPTSQMS
jgi:hypothetical protein